MRKLKLGFHEKLTKIMRIKLKMIDPHTREKGNSIGVELDFFQDFIAIMMNKV